MRPTVGVGNRVRCPPWAARRPACRRGSLLPPGLTRAVGKEEGQAPGRSSQVAGIIKVDPGKFPGVSALETEGREGGGRVWILVGGSKQF